jgi:voltage-gated sodium channel
MAVNLSGKNYPELFGTLGSSLYTLFTIMTLEGWTNDVVDPVMEKHPYALFFFIPFIVITTFWVLNLFIGIIVNAMQEEHTKAEAETREHERKAEREAMHDEAAPLVREIQALKSEIAALRREIAGGKSLAS